MKMFLQILLFMFEGSEDMMSKQYFPLCKVTMNAKKKMISKFVFNTFGISEFESGRCTIFCLLDLLDLYVV